MKKLFILLVLFLLFISSCGKVNAPSTSLPISTDTLAPLATDTLTHEPTNTPLPTKVPCSAFSMPTIIGGIEVYFYDDAQDCERIVETIQKTLPALPRDCENLMADIHVFRHVQEAVDKMIALRQVSEGRILPASEKQQVLDGFGTGGGGCQHGWCVYWQGPNWNRWSQAEMRGFIVAHTFDLCQAEIVWPNKAYQIPTSFLNGSAEVFTGEFLKKEYSLNFQGSWNKSDCPAGSVTLLEADRSYDTACAVIMGTVAMNQLVHRRGWEVYFDILRCMKKSGFSVCFNRVYGISLTQFYAGTPVPSTVTSTSIPILTATSIVSP